MLQLFQYNPLFVAIDYGNRLQISGNRLPQPIAIVKFISTFIHL